MEFSDFIHPGYFPCLISIRDGFPKKICQKKWLVMTRVGFLYSRCYIQLAVTGVKTLNFTILLTLLQQISDLAVSGSEYLDAVSGRKSVSSVCDSNYTLTTFQWHKQDYNVGNKTRMLMSRTRWRQCVCFKADARTSLLEGTWTMIGIDPGVHEV